MYYVLVELGNMPQSEVEFYGHIDAAFTDRLNNLQQPAFDYIEVEALVINPVPIACPDWQFTIMDSWEALMAQKSKLENCLTFNAWAAPILAKDRELYCVGQDA